MFRDIFYINLFWDSQRALKEITKICSFTL